MKMSVDNQPPAPLTLADLPRFTEHAVRHAAESGRDGDPIFSPYGDVDRPTYKRIATHRHATWPLALSKPGWVRTWPLWEGDQMVGHLDLIGGGLPSGMHRCRLGMGLERCARGQGWGGKLLDLAVAWAQAESSLFWLDLGVFSHNTPAKRLYASRGFSVVGGVEDRFRVDGVQIEDIQMTLAVG